MSYATLMVWVNVDHVSEQFVGAAAGGQIRGQRDDPRSAHEESDLLPDVSLGNELQTEARLWRAVGRGRL